NAPWVFMAVMIHVVIIAVMSVMYMGHKAAAKVEDVTSIAVSKPKEEALPELVQPPEAIDRKAIPKNEEAEVVSYQEDVYIPTTEATPEDLHLDRGDPNALDNLRPGARTGGTATAAAEAGHKGCR